MLAATIVIAIATVTYAVVAVLQLGVYKDLKTIAGGQKKAQEQDLRIAIYQERLKILHALKNLFDAVAQNKHQVGSEIIRLRGATAEVSLLFPPDIVDYVNEVIRRAKVFRDAEERIEKEGLSHGGREGLVKESRQEFDWFEEQQQRAAIEKFRPYLDFTKI